MNIKLHSIFLTNFDEFSSNLCDLAIVDCTHLWKRIFADTISITDLSPKSNMSTFIVKRRKHKETQNQEECDRMILNSLETVAKKYCSLAECTCSQENIREDFIPQETRDGVCPY